MPASILIVDDEKNAREALTLALEDAYDVFAAGNADEALRIMDAEHFDVVLTDLRMAGKSGMSVIDKAISMPYRPACIMMTAFGNVETAVEAMKRGATDFISKPIDISRLEVSIKNALQKRSQKTKDAPSVSVDKFGYKPSDAQIIYESKAMAQVLEKAKQVAASKATVMISGETGTGKELVSLFIHKSSPRAAKPFIPVHCAAIPANLLESELFGHEKGAFTGAVARRIGRFEAADKGTLFLDEIGEIDSPTQVKLLRFLETKSFERLGNTENTQVDIRLICATNRNLKEMAQNGEFREDLYYRLNVVEINIPPLRERREDIAPMLKFYINHFATENAFKPVKISEEALKILQNYSWAGNIRELRNFCENLVVTSQGGVLEAEGLDKKFFATAVNAQSKQNSLHLAKEPKLETFSKKENELELIKKALASASGNKTKAAELLGISRRTLHRKLSEYSLD